VQRSEQLVDIQIRLEPVFQDRVVSHLSGPGIRSLEDLSRALKKRHLPDGFGSHLRNVVADLDGIARSGYLWARYRGVFPLDHVGLTTRIDPAPNPDSRITLSEERDPLGLNRVKLDWRLSAIDKRSARRALEIFGEEVGRAGLGRVQIGIDGDDITWPPDTAGGWHHMGTTRMSDDPKQGVVDRNCKVHGIANLFIAGSSVFPTAGSGTPTLLIVALALRLAAHVKEKMPWTR
jgi:choline dehydrogenase-like flavoprotein